MRDPDSDGYIVRVDIEGEVIEVIRVVPDTHLAEMKSDIRPDINSLDIRYNPRGN